MSDIKIVDNLLPDGYANALEIDIVRNGFPWVYVDDVTYGNTEGTPGLTHVLFELEHKVTSNYLSFFKPIVYHIEKASGIAISTITTSGASHIFSVHKISMGCASLSSRDKT